LAPATRRRGARRPGDRRSDPRAPGIAPGRRHLIAGMVALKPAEADAYVARPDPARPIILVFGPDAGLVSERVDALVRSAVEDVNDPFALVRLDGDELAADPARLIDEANTVPLFGGRRAVRVKAG